jgi:3-hydroxyacyl-CoA dehydrogenase
VDAAAATRHGRPSGGETYRSNALSYVTAAKKSVGSGQMPSHIAASIAVINAESVVAKDKKEAEEILEAAAEYAPETIQKLLKEKRRILWLHPATEIVFTALAEAA